MGRSAAYTRASRGGGRARGLERLLALALLVWTAAPVAAADFRMQVPPMGSMEAGEYRAMDVETGEELWRHRWRVERQVREGQAVLRATQAGHGRRGRAQPATWSVQMEIRLGAEGGRLWARREVRGGAGDVKEVEERELDPAQGMGLVTRLHGIGEAAQVRRFLLSRRTVDIEYLPFALRLVPETAGQRLRFDLVTSDGSVVVMEARIMGRETVRVPAGSFECYRIVLTPTGVLGLVADLLLPKMRLWLSVAPPHAWIRSQGAEDGIGSREILRELVRFESRPG
jgi:hypothetical protein